jgi:hypothetical protein
MIKPGCFKLSASSTYKQQNICLRVPGFFNRIYMQPESQLGKLLNISKLISI